MEWRRAALAFDNMGNRKIEGTTQWTKYSVVLDVPEDAAAIAFGLLMAGKGQVWVDDLAFDVVGPDVASTALETEPQELPEDAKERFKANLKLLPKRAEESRFRVMNDRQAGDPGQPISRPCPSGLERPDNDIPERADRQPATTETTAPGMFFTRGVEWESRS